MASYENLYPGATYLLDPSYNFLGYRVKAGEMGGTTSIQTANQLREVSNMLNQGMKTTEVSVINPEVFEMMPKGHLTEIKRLNKLTGAESTIHAPIIDPSGFTDQGWSEENREKVENQFASFVERSHEIDPKGNIPVTIHASGIQGTEIVPSSHRLATPKEKGKSEIISKMVAVDRDNGRMVNLEREKLFYPTDPEGHIFTPEKRLESANASHWWNQLAQLVFYKDRGLELVKEAIPLVMGADMKNLTPEQTSALQQVQNGQIYLENTRLSLQNIYDQAYKYSNEKGKEKLKEAAQKFKNEFDRARLAAQHGDQVSFVGSYASSLQNLITNMQQITEHEPPKQYIPIEEFVKEKASKTLSNVALNAYKKFGVNAPIVSIENPPYGGAISTGEDLKNLIIRTRNEFADKLVDQGKGRGEANKIAERLIGATWDTSHISMIRKQGFGKERLIKETEAIAPYVKHLHYNDNFGTTHTDLPPGMGSVPMKEILRALQKKGFKGKRIFEGGNFFQHFRTSPFPYMLEYGGAPIYGMGSPYWNQLGYLGAYYAGHGPINPGIHHSTYGAGFQNLPLELGGEMPGDRGRFSGTPNQ